MSTLPLLAQKHHTGIFTSIQIINLYSTVYRIYLYLLLVEFLPKSFDNLAGILNLFFNKKAARPDKYDAR